MILKTVALLTLFTISIAVSPEESRHEDRSEDFNVYKAVEHFSNSDYYGKHNKKDHYDKHNKKDYYEKKDKYYEEGKPYKKQKYYKDENGNKPYQKKEKNYNKHWEEKEFSKHNDKEYSKHNDREFSKYNDKVHDKEFTKYNDKEFSKYNNKEFSKHNDREFSKYNDEEYRHDPDFTNLNEIDSNDFQKNKYSKYDKHSKHPNHFDDTRKNLEVSHHDKYDRNDEKYFEREKKQKDKSFPPYKEHPKQKYDLQEDTKVNYLFDRPVNPDSEYIDFKSQGKHDKHKENYEANYQNSNDEVYVKRVKKDFYKEMKPIDLSNPPPSNETVLMARYIIHNVDWAALATVSARSPTKGTPFANIKSVSDGPVNKGSGVPFFYLTPRDLSSQDLNKDNRCTVTVTLAETSYCRNENYDPEDPRCARLILTGKIKRVKAGTPEEDFAKDALFSRHPAMSGWPADHEWFFAKLKIGQIVLLDQFGGPKYIDVQEYLNVEPPTKT